MDVTRERISRILELREILLSFQSCFNFVNAAVLCAILESISGLEPWAVCVLHCHRRSDTFKPMDHFIVCFTLLPDCPIRHLTPAYNLYLYFFTGFSMYFGYGIRNSTEGHQEAPLQLAGSDEH